MIFRIFPSILEKYPKVNIGVLVVRGADNSGSDDKIYHLLEEVEEFIKLNFTPTELAKHPLISPWRTAYQEFGSKPSAFHCSVEAMMKRILKGEKVPQINKLVDICNYINLKHLVSIGGYDLDKTQTEIDLKHASGVESFTPMGTKRKEHPNKGEVIYEDDTRRVICRRWNWRDCEQTKITSETKNAIIFIDGLPPLTKEKVEDIQAEMKDLITTFCNAREVALHVANKELSLLEF
ncbi:hypothetical protein KY331_06085 [Candidatus Woesearchaeota archaeon]|nr:hypothetical protein [Candidatus Woesearchaeota archaeon]